MGAQCTCTSKDEQILQMEYVKPQNYSTKCDWKQKRNKILESDLPTETLLTELREACIDYETETTSVINN